MSEHLIIIFAYHYPPENAIGAARPMRFAKYLTRLGYKCRIFTAADQAGRDDPDTEYVPDPFVTNARRGIAWQSERAVRKLFLPGEMGMRWSHRACGGARAYVRAFVRAHPSARVTIFATFPQIGTLLAGRRLARSENLSWIADFRDPLAEERAPGGAFLQRRAYRWLERTMVRSAAAVIANTDAAGARLQKRFPGLAEKVSVIWNGFDPEERVVPLPASSGDCRAISHAGELYSGRSAAPVLESFARLIAAGRLSPAGIRLRLVGPAEPGSLPSPEFLNRARAEGWVELTAEQIPRREALGMAQSSDYLLLLQPQSSTQVPAKLFDYLQIGRPILAFLQPGSPAERLLAQAGVPYVCVYPCDSPGMADSKVSGFLNLPAKAVKASPWFEEHFNVERQTRQLETIIQSLQHDPAREANAFPVLPAAQETPRMTKT